MVLKTSILLDSCNNKLVLVPKHVCAPEKGVVRKSVELDRPDNDPGILVLLAEMLSKKYG
jgi:hypothetical protein